MFLHLRTLLSPLTHLLIGSVVYCLSFTSLSLSPPLSPLSPFSLFVVCLCAIWLCVQDHRPVCACVEARHQYQMASSITLYGTKFSVFNWNGWPASTWGSICRPAHLHCGCRCMSVPGLLHGCRASWLHSNHYILWATAPSLEFFTCFGGEPPVWTTASNDFLPCCGLSVHSTDLALQQLCDFMQSHVSIIGASFCVV